MTREKTLISSFELKLSTRKSTTTATIKSDTPFCMAILGDFSNSEYNKTNRPHSQKKYKIVEIDRDNFDDVLKNLQVNIQLKLGETSSTIVEIPITEIDDFSPDNIFLKVGLFQKLRDLRGKLLNRTTFREAANEVLGLMPSEKETPQPPTPQPSVDSKPIGNLLDAVINSSEVDARQYKGTTGSELVDELIKEAVAKYAIPAEDPKQHEMVTAVDQAITAQMQSILHHPHFQSVESSWRAVYFLCRRLGTGSHLKIFLIDISKEELQDDISAEDLSTTKLFKLLCEPQPSNITWSLLLGNYSFGATIDDADLLARIGSIAQYINTSFIAGAHSDLIQCESLGRDPDPDNWQKPLDPDVTMAWLSLRNRSESQHIALVLPRFLLRMPYGKEFGSVENFAFEEMSTAVSHDNFLWGNAAYAIAYLLAQSFENNGWDMKPGDYYQIDDLPLFYYDDDGESVLKPCAEILMTEKAGTKISEAGLMSLWSIPNSGSVRVSAFRALSQPGNPITGPWITT